MNFFSMTTVLILGLASALQGQSMLTTKQLEGLVEKDWHDVKSRQALEVPSDTIGWSYRFTPPFPLVWPPAATAGVVYYGIPYGLAPGRLSDGEHVGEAWVKVELVSGQAPRVLVLREMIQPLGIQGVRPLSEKELRLEREHAQGPQHVATLTGLRADTDSQAIQIRGYYCSWVRHNHLTAKRLAAVHSDFFTWIACP